MIIITAVKPFTNNERTFTVCCWYTGFYEDDFEDYNMGFQNMNFMGNRGRGGMRPPRGRMQGGMMMDDRPRGPPGSHYISKTGHSVHMRGMPFLAIEQDVFDVSQLGAFTLVYRHMWVQLFWHSFEAVCIDGFYMIMHPCFIRGHLVFVVRSKLTCFLFSLLDFSSLHLCSQFGWNLSMEEMAVEQERPMWTLPPTRKPWRPWKNTELTCVGLQFLQQPSYYASLFHLHKDGEGKNGYSEDSAFLLANPLWSRVVVGKTEWKQWDYMQGRVLVWLLMTIKSRILIFSTLNNDKHDLRSCFWMNQILGIK